MCLSVLKDLANLLTDMVLLYKVASHRSLEGFCFFWCRVQPPKKNEQKNTPPPPPPYKKDNRRKAPSVL